MLNSWRHSCALVGIVSIPVYLCMSVYVYFFLFFFCLIDEYSYWSGIGLWLFYSFHLLCIFYLILFCSFNFFCHFSLFLSLALFQALCISKLFVLLQSFSFSDLTATLAGMIALKVILNMQHTT